MKHTIASTIAALHQRGVPDPVEEFAFHATRKWRFDFAWPDFLIAWEIDGAVYSQGRHTRGKGYEEDARKLNEALLLGWRVIRTTPKQVASGEALTWLEKALGVIPA